MLWNMKPIKDQKQDIANAHVRKQHIEAARKHLRQKGYRGHHSTRPGRSMGALQSCLPQACLKLSSAIKAYADQKAYIHIYIYTYIHIYIYTYIHIYIYTYIEDLIIRITFEATRQSRVPPRLDGSHMPPISVHSLS